MELRLFIDMLIWRRRVTSAGSMLLLLLLLLLGTANWSVHNLIGVLAEALVVLLAHHAIVGGGEELVAPADHPLTHAALEAVQVEHGLLRPTWPTAADAAAAREASPLHQVAGADQAATTRALGPEATKVVVAAVDLPVAVEALVRQVDVARVAPDALRVPLPLQQVERVEVVDAIAASAAYGHRCLAIAATCRSRRRRRTAPAHSRTYFFTIWLFILFSRLEFDFFFCCCCWA